MTRSRRKHHTSSIRHIHSQAILLVISFLYLMIAAMLLLFGYIVGWDIVPGRPVGGVLMIAAGIVVFVLGPRAIKRLTGRDPIDPPPYI